MAVDASGALRLRVLAPNDSRVASSSDPPEAVEPPTDVALARPSRPRVRSCTPPRIWPRCTPAGGTGSADFAMAVRGDPRMIAALVEWEARTKRSRLG